MKKYLIAALAALALAIPAAGTASPTHNVLCGPGCSGGGGAAFPSCGPGTQFPYGSVIVVIGVSGAWRCVAPNTWAPA